MPLEPPSLPRSTIFGHTARMDEDQLFLHPAEPLPIGRARRRDQADPHFIEAPLAQLPTRHGVCRIARRST
jgi:hypothetical protein